MTKRRVWIGAMFFNLLAFAASASAECAWVLWTETKQSGKGDPTWKFDHNVYDTRAGCEAALSREMDATVETFRFAGAQLFQPPGVAPDVFIRLGERRVTVQKENAWFLIYNHACLPDTVDPRAPKGK